MGTQNSIPLTLLLQTYQLSMPPLSSFCHSIFVWLLVKTLPKTGPGHHQHNSVDPMISTPQPNDTQYATCTALIR